MEHWLEIPDLPGVVQMHQGIEIDTEEDLGLRLVLNRERHSLWTRAMDVIQGEEMWHLRRIGGVSSLRRDDGILVLTTDGSGPRLLGSEAQKADIRISCPPFEHALSLLLLRAGLVTRTRRFWIPESVGLRAPEAPVDDSMHR